MIRDIQTELKRWRNLSMSIARAYPAGTETRQTYAKAARVYNARLVRLRRDTKAEIYNAGASQRLNEE